MSISDVRNIIIISYNIYSIITSYTKGVTPLIEGCWPSSQVTWTRNASGVITGCWRLCISRYWPWWRLCNIGRSFSGWVKGIEVWPVCRGDTSGGGTAGEGAGGMSGVTRVLAYFGPRKTLEESVWFITGLASSSSRNTKFRCPPTRLAFCLISSTLKQVLLSLGCLLPSNKLKVDF